MAKNRLDIRPATSNDAEAIASVQIVSWRETYTGIVDDAYLDAMSLEQNRERWDRILEMAVENPTRVTLVASVDDRVIGFASGGPALGEDPPADGDLFAIYMVAAYHGHGFGRELFEAFCRSMTRSGFRSLRVWVLKENRSGGFYRAMGGVEGEETTITIGSADYITSSYLWPAIPTTGDGGSIEEAY